jgi:hypothetical protein
MMTATGIQSWVGVVGALLTAIVGLTKYFSYRSRRDRQTDVGKAFANTVEALASENETKRMAAAVLMRRFFDSDAEQGGKSRPYAKEAVAVIAALLREEQHPKFQKILADGLRYAGDLRGADLQGCDLQNSFLGDKKGDRITLDLSGADLFEAQCAHASFRGTRAVNTVFYGADLKEAVFIEADLREADFRAATLTGAKFHLAKIGNADFSNAIDVPTEIVAALGHGKARPNAAVPAAEGSR